MAEPRCLNCNATNVEAARFCGACGQRTDTTRLSLGDVARDLMHSFVNIERGPLVFAWALLTEPGTVAREFVDGKRRRHFGPFATLAVLGGLTSLVINLAGFQALAHDGVTSAPAILMQRHFNLLQLAQLPVLGLACAVFFRSARMTLAEHMVLVAYSLGVRAVFLSLVVSIAYLQSTTLPSQGWFIAFWVGWFAYFGWAAAQFYPGTRWRTWLRGSVVAAIGYLAIEATMVSAGFVYEWLGN